MKNFRLLMNADDVYLVYLAAGNPLAFLDTDGRRLIVKNSFVLAVAGTSLAAMALAGCGSSDSTPAAGSDIGTAKTDLGRIVVDGKGLTAYVFDKDVADSGKSTCAAGCAAVWKPITSSSAKPKVDGVTGTVATITGTAGGKQITVNGRPIYTYADDKATGDVEGQGEGGVWHVLSPAGNALTKKAPAASSGGY